jgi:hypothetical protein
MIVYRLNTVPRYDRAPVVVHANQYDSGGVWRFFVTDGDMIFNMINVTVTLNIHKPDGTVYSGEVVGGISTSGYVNVPIEEQMTAAAGEAVAELVFVDDDDNRKSTANFVIDIERSPLDMDGVESESLINYVEGNRTAAEEATEAAEAATTAATAAATAAQTAAQLAGAFNAKVKAALMEVINHIAAWTDGNAETYRNNLIDAMYSDSYPALVAIFLPGDAVIYTDDNLETVKLHLVVMYRETATSDAVTLSASDYTLTGTLTDGDNTLTVTYNGQSINVVVPAVDWHSISSWSIDADTNTEFVARGSGTYNYSGTETSTAGLTIADGTRYSAVTTRGEQQLINAGRGGTYLPDTGYYPIPVMTGATQAVGSITPSTQYLAMILWNYDSATGYYTRLASTGWHQGSYTMDLSSYSGNLYLTVGCKYDSEGASYPTPPESVGIAFS